MGRKGDPSTTPLGLLFQGLASQLAYGKCQLKLAVCLAIHAPTVTETLTAWKHYKQT